MSNLPANRNETAPAPVKPAQMPALGKSGFMMMPSSLEEAMKFAEILAKSTIVPKQFQGRAGDLLVAIMMGAELGVSPLQALSGIATINGRAGIWGDLGVALVQRTGQLEYMMEDWDEAAQISTVRIKRRGMPAKIFTFSMADAKRAGLAGRDTYKQYPQRMCGWRAKTYAMRAEFADALKGMAIVEEIMDLPPQSEPIEMPAPIAMPREIGEAAPETDQQSHQERQASEDEPPIFVAEAKEKSYKDKKTGVEKKYYVVEFSDGRVGSTFSESLFNLAYQAGADRKPVRYLLVESKKGGSFNLDDLQVFDAPADSAPQEGSEDGTGR